MNLFDEISHAKQDFPKVNTITKEVKSHELNFYQLIAIGLFIITLCIGVVFGNLFATCEASSYFYSAACTVRQFNFYLMILIWFLGGLISLFVFAIGHIIVILCEISEKLSKFKS
jgi:hypothetical protein